MGCRKPDDNFHCTRYAALTVPKLDRASGDGYQPHINKQKIRSITWQLRASPMGHECCLQMIKKPEGSWCSQQDPQCKDLWVGHAAWLLCFLALKVLGSVYKKQLINEDE